MGGFARFFCINKTILKSEPDFWNFWKKGLHFKKRWCIIITSICSIQYYMWLF